MLDAPAVSIPVIEEELEVQKQQVVTGAVRIRKIVHQREEVVDEPLFTSTVGVERVTVNRVVEGPVPVRHEGETMIVSIVEERLVITKELVLKEELHITRHTSEFHHPQRVTVRSEEAIVERIDS